MNDRKPDVEYWTIENTGWSGGISWFKSRDRFDKENVFRIAEKRKSQDRDILFRVVHVTIFRKPDGEVIYRSYFPID